MFQLFTCVFIISLTIISITKGMNNLNNSSSSINSCNIYYGNIEHIKNNSKEEQINFKPNISGKMNVLNVLGNNPLFNQTVVALQIGENDLCSASIGKPGNCGTNQVSLTGNLKFIVSEKIVIEVPVKNAYFFTNNQCNIELENYDNTTHVMNLKINGMEFQITPTGKNKVDPMACKKE
ncbi:hypothetical protein Mgra_00004805 [Meloidogyne graminicola]|uniref:Uncharacterized protein n=1 Tax=Meloidogyne graminicola TaxID=189291 RepID=A0A8S9ZR96_9BILA|nr:hypothetical protein Mgra_00004805 [Meloidogyne graminicola]